MFLPASILGSGKLKDAPDASLLIPIRKYGETFLVTSGDDARAIMLTGTHAGHYMKRFQGEHYEGMYVSRIQIEVDIRTAFAVTYVQRPVLSFLRSAAGEALVAMPETGSYGRGPAVTWTGDPIGAEDEAVGFTSWNAYVDVGEDRRVIYEHRGDPVQFD